MPATITSYQVVVAIHVMAVVVAFGVLFAYPVILPWARRNHPRAMPAIHQAQSRIGRILIGPGMVVILGAGIYLASKSDTWDQSWVSTPLLILLILGGMAGMFFVPTERKLGELAERDLQGGGELGEEYGRLFSRLQSMLMVAALLVLVAIFFMVVKP
jgi:uncharacterized membrane protein